MDDSDFDKTLQQLDEQQSTHKKARLESASPSRSEEKPKPNENSPPNKNPPQKGIASKLSAKLKEFECKKRDYSDQEKSSEHDGKFETRDKVHSPEKLRQDSREVVMKSDSKILKSLNKEESLKYTEDRSQKGDRKEEHIHKTQDKVIKEEKKVRTHENSEKGTPKKDTANTAESYSKDKKISPKKDKVYSGGEKTIKEEKNVTPVKSKKTDDSSQINSTPQDDKKQQARTAYMQYLRRSGPANPGSKLIPEVRQICSMYVEFS